jgi:hypothetical protein
MIIKCEMDDYGIMMKGNHPDNHLMIIPSCVIKCECHGSKIPEENGGFSSRNWLHILWI